MSGDDADDVSDRDRRFDRLSATDEDSTTADKPPNTDGTTEADDPASNADSDRDDDPSQDLDTWEWTDPEVADSTAGPGPDSDRDTSELSPAGEPSGSDTDDSDADAVHTSSAPLNATARTDTPDADSGGAQADDRPTSDAVSSDDSGKRRTHDRIWNRSPSTQEGSETTAESPSSATPTDLNSGASIPAHDEAASARVEEDTTSSVTDATSSVTDTEPSTTDTTSSVTAPADTDIDSAAATGPATGGGDADALDVESPNAESLVAGLDLTPGTSILLQCGSQDDREDVACHDLLGLTGDGGDRNALLIQYRQLAPNRLGHIAEHAARTTVVAVGYSQPVPESVDDRVETIEINNPNDITRLGILVSGMLDDWADHDATTVVCYDSVNVLLEYKDVQNTFRFLHVFLGTLESADAIAHFHADPLASTPQKINTLKPLFDDVVSIDSMGVDLE